MAPVGWGAARGSAGRDQVSVDDDVVRVVSRVSVEGSLAGDQPQCRLDEAAVNLPGGKVALGNGLDRVDAERWRRAVRAMDADKVTGSQLPEPEEDRRPLGGVDVSNDDCGAFGARRRAESVPSRFLGARQR